MESIGFGTNNKVLFNRPTTASPPGGSSEKSAKIEDGFQSGPINFQLLPKGNPFIGQEQDSKLSISSSGLSLEPQTIIQETLQMSSPPVAAEPNTVVTIPLLEQPETHAPKPFSFTMSSNSSVVRGGVLWVNPLRGVDPKEMSPLGDLLTLTGQSVPQTLQSRREAISGQAEQSRRFNKALQECLYETVVGDDGKKSQKSRPDVLPRLQVLEKFLIHGERPAGWSYPSDATQATSLDALFQADPPRKLLPEQMTGLIEGFKDSGAFADVVRVYESLRDKNPAFKNYDIPREYYVVALNKMGASRIKDSISESEAMISDRISAQNLKPVSFLEANQRHLYRSMNINGEVLSGLGKAFKNIHTLAEKQIDSLAAKANFAQLAADLSATKLEDFKVGDSTAGQVGHQKATGKFQERIKTLSDRKFPIGSEKFLQNQKDLSDWLESSVGLKMEQWPGGVGAFSTQLQAGKDPIEAAEQLSGKGRQDWPLFQNEVVAAASTPFNEAAARVARGKNPAELQAVAEKMAGISPTNFVAQATLNAKMESLDRDVKTQGSVDPELVAFVSSKKQTNACGKNLLELSRQALEVSRDYYLAGFGVDFEYYPGINVVYNELALGHSKTAEDLIPLVQYAVAREGGKTSTDYWNLATQVELAAIGGQADTAHDVLPRVLRSAKAGWELGSTADNLEKLARQFKEEKKDASVLDFVASKFRQRMEVGFPAPDSFDQEQFIKEAQQQLQENLLATTKSAASSNSNSPDLGLEAVVTQKILEKSKSFADAFTSKFVGGSWAFVSKGGVADTVINRPTVAALREVNTHLGFDELNSPEDFEQFRQTMHEYIDAKFGLVDKTGERPMEDLVSLVHKRRDKFTENRHDYCESRVSGNGRTNLVTEIALGQSDCRHTDATFQAAFDLWKRDHQTRELQSCLDAAVQGRNEDYKKSFDKALAWNKIQVVSLDMAFRANVQPEVNSEGIPQKYALKTDEQGRFVRTADEKFVLDPKTGAPFALEDHTMPVLLHFDDNGHVGKMRAVDPFYRGLWNVGDVEVDPKGILDDKLGFHLGSKGREASDGKPVDLYAVPCGYSGRALGRIPGECGQVTIGGLEFSLSTLDPILSTQPLLKDFTDAITDLPTNKS